MIEETFTRAKSVWDRHQINTLKSNFFRLVKDHMEYLWFQQKKKNCNAINFKRLKFREFPDKSQDNSFPQNHGCDVELSTGEHLPFQPLEAKFPVDHPNELYAKLGGSSLQRMGIVLSDNDLDLRYNIENSEPAQPLAYGGVNLGEDESKVLLLHPKMRLLEPIKEERIEHEMEKCLSLIR